MNRDETIAVLALLRAGCPQAYLNLSAADAEAMVTVWSEMFLDTPAALVTAAVKTYLWRDRSGKFPAIGAIRDMIDEINQVCDHCAYGTTLYEYLREEANRFPPAVQTMMEKVYRSRHREKFGTEFTSQLEKRQIRARLQEGKQET